MSDHSAGRDDELHGLLDGAIGGDDSARDALEAWLDATRPRPEGHQLAALMERTLHEDKEALGQLERWFRRSRCRLMEARRLRKELEDLAYLMTIRVASKKLEARYRDVRRDAASIAFRVWEKKVPALLDGLEQGHFESVLQLIKWIGQASEFAILNLIREERAGPDLVDTESVPASDLLARPEDGDEARQIEEDRQEDQRSILRGIFESLRGHHDLFTIVVLTRFMKLNAEQAAKILAISTRVAYKRMEEATRVIGEGPPGSA